MTAPVYRGDLMAGLALVARDDLPLYSAGLHRGSATDPTSAMESTELAAMQGLADFGQAVYERYPL
jgi:hypothetical protein